MLAVNMHTIKFRFVAFGALMQMTWKSQSKQVERCMTSSHGECTYRWFWLVSALSNDRGCTNLNCGHNHPLAIKDCFLWLRCVGLQPSGEVFCRDNRRLYCLKQHSEICDRLPAAFLLLTGETLWKRIEQRISIRPPLARGGVWRQEFMAFMQVLHEAK